MTVSNKVVSVEENNIPEKIICTAKAKPAPKFRWYRINSTHNIDEDINMDSVEILSNEHTLKLKSGVKRTANGDIVCEAYNTHGKSRVITYLNVKYKPECSLTQTEIDDEKVLLCTATAKPVDVNFYWLMQDENDTIAEDAIIYREYQSILKLDQIFFADESPRTFVCTANNTVGISTPCTLKIEGVLPWWKWWSRTALLVAAGIGLLLILVIILCLIILCICRKRRAASKLPVKGGGENGVDNPGAYENLPFHGLQQAPNKPIQIIQPRVVRALITQNNSKSPEAIIAKQLESNPSFTPRILSCAPFSHNPNALMSKTQNFNATSNQIYMNQHLSLSNLVNQNRNQLKVNDQKYYSLNMKREKLKRAEPKFSSMKVVRKRKLDRFYPSKQRIDYIIVNKNQNARSKEVIYANYPFSSQPHLFTSQSNVNNSINSMAFQNLTDSIQIHENSSLNMSNTSAISDSKTPTPAPRSNKSSPQKAIPKPKRDIHIYANVSSQIMLSKSDPCNINQSINTVCKIPNNIELTQTLGIPKTLPRTFKNDSVVDMAKIYDAGSNSSTFPKRTSKSGKLFDTVEGGPKNNNKNEEVINKGKIISSRTPSRNSSFSKEDNNLNEELQQKKLKTELVKIMPSIVNATPKVKPYIINANMNDMIFKGYEAHNKGVPKRLFTDNVYQNKSKVGKVIPKQNMLIKPPNVPLQIPNLTDKPVPKTHLKRSQSSLSGKGISSELLQHYKGSSDLQDGSLVKAKIRELNLRQNVNNHQQEFKSKLNQTYPSDPPPRKTNHTVLQKHHSFCYFQPIRSLEETKNNNNNYDTNEQLGPLIYKPHISKVNNYCDSRKTWIDKRKPLVQIDPKHRESFEKLHDLLKRDNNNVLKKKPVVNTYTLNSLNRHKYVPKDDNNKLTTQKRIVYADLDLENNDNSSISDMCTNEQGTQKDTSKTDAKKKQRTEYATIKFEEVEL